MLKRVKNVSFDNLTDKFRKKCFYYSFSKADINIAIFPLPINAL